MNSELALVCQICNLFTWRAHTVTHPYAPVTDVGIEIQTLKEFFSPASYGIKWSHEDLNQVCFIPKEFFPCITNNRKCFPVQFPLY